MNDPNQSNLESICKELFDEFRGVLTWKWDDRIGTILAEFSSDKIDDIHPILKKHFPVSCDNSNISKAPQLVQALDKHLGALRPTQHLFCSNPTHDAFVFCAWWPWGNGTKISLRIAIFNIKSLNSDRDHLMVQLKELAGV